MPCNSDYLAASGQELESQRVCQLIKFLHENLKKKVPKWITQASEDYYGNVNRLDEATQILCSCCRSLSGNETEKLIYNAKNPLSRKLADWWERHQEWDERRVKEEQETRKRIILKERALRKLSTEEIEALGLEVE